jgi:sensor histidine kinase YesM
MLDQLIQFLRATLSSSRTESTTLAEEFALLEAYLGLMAVRMGERLRYAFELPAELRSVRVPPMLLQPLVENAIAHGIEPNIEGGTITISAARQDGMLALTVSDTGRGPHAGAGKPGQGWACTTRANASKHCMAKLPASRWMPPVMAVPSPVSLYLTEP